MVGILVYRPLVDVMHSIRAARRAGVQYVVLGGPHINDFPEESLALEGVTPLLKEKDNNLMNSFEFGKRGSGKRH